MFNIAVYFISFLCQHCTEDAAETFDKENGWVIHQNDSTPGRTNMLTGFDSVPGNSEMLI